MVEAQRDCVVLDAAREPHCLFEGRESSSVVRVVETFLLTFELEISRRVTLVQRLACLHHHFFLDFIFQ